MLTQHINPFKTDPLNTIIEFKKKIGKIVLKSNYHLFTETLKGFLLCVLFSATSGRSKQHSLCKYQ